MSFSTTSNTLSVNAPPMRHLTPRKSIIGRLERSSFQAQRLSDVSLAFSQQITAKVGLKLPASQERIIEQTRWLYLRYVFVKLRENKLPLRDLNLTKSSRARRAAALNQTRIIVSISEPPSAAVAGINCAGSDIIRQPRFSNDSNVSFGSLSSYVHRNSVISNIDLNNFNQNFESHAQNYGQTSAMPQNTLKPRYSDCLSFKQPPQFDFKATTPFFATAPPTPARLSLCDDTANEARSRTTTATANAGNISKEKKYLMDPTINNQIFSVIVIMINMLKDSRPEFYSDTIYEVIGLDKFSSLECLLETQKTICQEMTRVEISWDRIVALFSLFGAMSLDCVRLGAPEHVGPLLDGFIGFVERDLALWISQQGGWESFLYARRSNYKSIPAPVHFLLIAAPILLWLIRGAFD